MSPQQAAAAVLAEPLDLESLMLDFDAPQQHLPQQQPSQQAATMQQQQQVQEQGQGQEPSASKQGAPAPAAAGVGGAGSGAAQPAEQQLPGGVPPPPLALPTEAQLQQLREHSPQLQAAALLLLFCLHAAHPPLPPPGMASAAQQAAAQQVAGPATAAAAGSPAANGGGSGEREEEGEDAQGDGDGRAEEEGPRYSLTVVGGGGRVKIYLGREHQKALLGEAPARPPACLPGAPVGSFAKLA
jgi:hypothetical protein